ncbi:MAG: filamentous hemagglutinin N-terminal domain-containing protein [Desulfamplus sp.]|nr:filamentous hemagglutinin N-terminal domain-containing protein [Desulfamplus sp.]
MTPQKSINNLSLIFLICLFFLTSPTLLYADISTDGSVGAAQTLTGPDYAIPEALGTLKGSNLFHSFDKFSIKTEESATFTGSDSIKNVISRVTGGEKSEIEGTLRSNVGKADFYFINPNGVVFGQNAKIDVPAAFHVSTGNELKFADGASFKAAKTEQSTLTQAAPEAFGFLETQSASIEVNGSNLEFKPESKVSLTSSKDITIKGTKIGTEEKQASIVNSGGEIELKASGDLLLDNARVESSGNGGGKITVKAGSVKLQNNSKIAADNKGDKTVDGNGVEIKADKELEIKQGSRIQSNVFSSGDSGTVKVEAQNMLIKQQEGEEFTGVFIEVEPEAKGNGKAIDVKVKDKLTIQGVGAISSITYGYGNTGYLNISAGDFLMDGEGNNVPYRDSFFIAGIASEANKISSGNGNDVSIYVDNLFTMLNGCIISGNAWAKGNAGNVAVRAGNMKIDRQGSDYLTGVSSLAVMNSEGNAGNIEITITEYLELLNGGQITSSSDSKGNAGNVKITASNMKIDGQGNYAGVSSNALAGSEGNAGNIEITVTEYLELLNGSQIASSSDSKGNAGNVKINAGNMKINGQGSSNFTGVASSAYQNSEGNAGTVEITVAEYFDLINGGEISSTTQSKGNAGSVKINAGNMKIDGQGNSAGIYSNARAGSEGNAGQIIVIVKDLLDLLNGGVILNDTVARGDAGSITINADNIKIDGQGNASWVTGVVSRARTNSEGNAGKIEISLNGLLELSNGAEISNSTSAKGDAGCVRINAGNIKLDGQGNYAGIYSNALVGSEGNAGTIEITVSGLIELLSGGSIISDTNSKGTAGNILINTGNMKIGGQDSEYVNGVRSYAGRNSEGNAGVIEITVTELLEVLNGGEISSSTFAKGNAGNVKIDAGNMTIDGQGKAIDISSDASSSSKGKAGEITITVTGLLQVLNGAQISSKTWSKGDAGVVKINANNMKIDGQGSSKTTGVASSSEKTNSLGKAGTVEITIIELLEVLNGGSIASSTFSKGDAGNVKINAGNMKIAGQGSSNNLTGVASSAEQSSEGKAGTVEITVAELLEVLNGGEISSSTWSKGDAGGVKINAGNMKIAGGGALSSALTDSIGNSGIVDIRVMNLLEIFDGIISTGTLSKGDAGDVLVNADELIVHSSFIESGAYQDSTGYVGNVSVNATSIILMNEGYIVTIAHNTLPEEKLANMPDNKSITLNTKQLSIEGQSKITSESTKNVPASDININADSIYLHDGQITTSVLGTNGDGGDISINEHSDSNPAGLLVMQNGHIKANTSAEGSKGGSIRINPDTLLIADKSMPFQIGGESEFFDINDKKNVIQAADPSKNPQDIQAPEVPIDLGTSIINTASKFSEPVKMAENYCRLIGTKKASRLTRGGKGGIPQMLSQPSSIFFTDERLEEFLRYEKEKEKNN